ncbi:hypothetical protein [Paenibacillus sp. CF384]|uniref:hypothetical protein n=1 Tax=Paenibacillus sp. CF384 TaxID=1884382 RepID=UPI00089A9D66|nr:hypothetical protein [Paenibacillus sp. CF384]SDW48029.1 hypothetical protein SAMN05518855_1002289 [Paenibacillus sp. CF384]
MLKKSISKLLIACTFAVSLFAFTTSVGAVSPTTPYSSWVNPDLTASTATIQGAEYELYHDQDTFAKIARDLPIMKNDYNINTLNLYNLETLDINEKNALFNQMSLLGMKSVPRIEWIGDVNSFRFDQAHADAVVSYYDSMLQYLVAKSSQVVYFAVNIPNDNSIIAGNYGGFNSQAWKNGQKDYAGYLYLALTNRLNQLGYANPKLFISIHYGWDNSWDVPVYDSSKADGYFLQTYSYPLYKDCLPGSSCWQSRYGAPSTNRIINVDGSTDSIAPAGAPKNGLKETLGKFMGQYQNQNKPLVVEFGFHTQWFNNNTPTDQTAGLQYDIAAKNTALTAAYNYFKSYSPNMIKGAMYFGWNLVKDEGNPSAAMDWSLQYPYSGFLEAENPITTSTNAITFNDASTGINGVALSALGKYAVFFNSRKDTILAITYSNGAAADAKLHLYINGGTNGIPVTFPTTGAWTGPGHYSTIYLGNLNIPWGASIKLQFDNGDQPVNIDKIFIGT